MDVLMADNNNNLQKALDTLQNWSKNWLLNLNIKTAQLFLLGNMLTNHTY